MADAVIMGNIHIVDDPEAEGGDSVPYPIKRALVIQFATNEELRAAIKSGECKFTVMDNSV